MSEATLKAIVWPVSNGSKLRHVAAEIGITPSFARKLIEEAAAELSEDEPTPADLKALGRRL